MIILELHASDVHAALGQLLDRTRVAGLRLATINVNEEAGGYRIRASIDGDCEIVDKLARRIGTIVAVNAVQVKCERGQGLSMPAPSSPLTLAS